MLAVTFWSVDAVPSATQLAVGHRDRVGISTPPCTFVFLTLAYSSPCAFSSLINSFITVVGITAVVSVTVVTAFCSLPAMASLYLMGKASPRHTRFIKAFLYSSVSNTSFSAVLPVEPTTPSGCAVPLPCMAARFACAVAKAS